MGGAGVSSSGFAGRSQARGRSDQPSRRVLDASCAAMVRWRTVHPEFAGVTMSVNVSAVQLQDPDFVHKVQATVDGHGLASSDVVLELTETTLLKALPDRLEALQQLRRSGFGIAIDDFGIGIGYASLRYLATMPITAVKIDRSFTAGLPDDPHQPGDRRSGDPAR